MNIRILTILMACNLSGVLSIANQMVSVNTNCSREFLEIDLFLVQPFKGIIFAKDFSEECVNKGLYYCNRTPNVIY